jgi:hypothetical protein
MDSFQCMGTTTRDGIGLSRGTSRRWQGLSIHFNFATATTNCIFQNRGVYAAAFVECASWLQVGIFFSNCATEQNWKRSVRMYFLQLYGDVEVLVEMIVSMVRMSTRLGDIAPHARRWSLPAGGSLSLKLQCTTHQHHRSTCNQPLPSIPSLPRAGTAPAVPHSLCGPIL